MAQLMFSTSLGAKEQTLPSMAEGPKGEDRVQNPEPLTDFCREDRHDVVQTLAYQHWEKRGRPLGSPEIDWFAAEKTVRSQLLLQELSSDQTRTCIAD